MPNSALAPPEIKPHTDAVKADALTWIRSENSRKYADSSTRKPPKILSSSAESSAAATYSATVLVSR